MIKKNNAPLYNLKSTPSKKKKEEQKTTLAGSISFSQQSSFQLTPKATVQEIEYL